MKIIICDVGNAACAFAITKNGRTIMIDCGCSSEKENPVDVFKRHALKYGTKDYSPVNGSLFLSKLIITHPDDDHVRNISRVYRELNPRQILRQHCHEYSDYQLINPEYRNISENNFSPLPPNTPRELLGFDKEEYSFISVQDCKADPSLKTKERNNSSIITYLREDNLGVLFCGDLETAGWEYLSQHHHSFFEMLAFNKVNVLIAPHHGHKSGFPKALFDIIGNVDVVIHSKDSEAFKDGTDVSTQYNNYSDGHSYKNLNDGKSYQAKVLTTRSNGHIFLQNTAVDGYTISTEKASPNNAVMAKWIY